MFDLQQQQQQQQPVMGLSHHLRQSCLYSAHGEWSHGQGLQGNQVVLLLCSHHA
jgi:hypothetical protein